MSVASEAALESAQTVADLLWRWGDIPPERVRLHPPPGTATEEDLLRTETVQDSLFELVEATLVEKAMGFREAIVAATLVRMLGNFAKAADAGIVAGPDATIRFAAGLVHAPDVAFISWDRLGGEVPTEPLAIVIPDLAVEVLSAGNPRREMARKRREYFAAGVRLVWEIDPAARTATVYTRDDAGTRLQASDTLTGGTVLPGLLVALREIFSDLNRQGSCANP